MSIRLDPRRVGTLKQLAADSGMRPGDLVRQWVEEHIDAARSGTQIAAGGGESLAARLEALTARVEALEATRSEGVAVAKRQETTPVEEAPPVEPAPPVEEVAPVEGKRTKRVSAAPTGRVALHDEMIAVISERGPLTAAELATAIAERGRYAPPRSGKPLDAAMISQRVSNPTYRSRFTRNEGRIGLAG